MDLDLRGKRALVTGGSRGIGLAVARELAREGASVTIAARNKAMVDEVARTLAAETGSAIIGVQIDTAQDDSVKAAIATAVQAQGGIDILVNCAAMPGGHSAPPKLSEITNDLFWDDVNTKVLGYLRCAREAAPHMIAKNWGRIINISGLAARGTGSTIGSMRNVAVAAMSKNLADELGPHGINVTTVHPGLTRTERTPGRVAELAAAASVTIAEMESRMAKKNVVGRMIEAREIAYIVAFLASPKSVAITGDAIAAGGGVAGPIYY